MSAKASTMSKPRTRLEKAVANSPRAMKARASAEASVTPPPRPATPAPIEGEIMLATSIEMVPFRQLRRAPENVRRHRPDEDIMSLADDIAAHGLLQSLIGYKAQHPLGGGALFAWIAGGGRRLQALQLLVDEGRLSFDVLIPVLIRPQEEAVEISLSENLAKRDMNPVDECNGFAALMEIGNIDEAGLAKRFGFSERYVKQRLRLATLADPILAALGDRKITIDAAMAYATSSDVELQKKIFAVQEKSGHDRHGAARIRSAYSTAQLTTKSALYVFVGADRYEQDGGGYEDDLFSAGADDGNVRKLTDGPVLLELARRRAAAELDQLETKVRAEYPDLGGILLAPSARIDVSPWQPKAPTDYVLVEGAWAHVWEPLWRNALRHRVPIIAIGGISQDGEMAVKQTAFFVPKDDLAKVKPAPNSASAVSARLTSADRARIARQQEIDLKAWRLAVGPFAGTFLEGRAYWPKGWVNDIGTDHKRPGGKLVAVLVWVSDEEHQAQIEEAGRRYDAEAADQSPSASADDADESNV